MARLADVLNPATVRNLMAHENAISQEQLLIATPPPVQRHGHFDPNLLVAPTQAFYDHLSPFVANPNDLDIITGYISPSGVQYRSDMDSDLLRNIGHNFGTSLGSTAGNILEESAQFWGTYAQAAHDGLSAVLGDNPSASLLADLGLVPPNKVSESARTENLPASQAYSAEIPRWPYVPFYGPMVPYARGFEPFSIPVSNVPHVDGRMTDPLMFPQLSDTAESFHQKLIHGRSLQSLDLPGLLANTVTTKPPLDEQNLLSQLQALLNPNPSPIPSAAQVWNNAVGSVTNDTEQLGLPILDNFNASIPEVSTIGNAAGLSDINEVAGQNMGSALGSTVGNVLSGTSSLVSNYFEGAQAAFLDAFSPNLGQLMGMFGTSKRRLLAEASMPECTQKDVIYSSAKSVAYNDVDSLRVCQMLCQINSDPLALHGCPSVIMENRLPCLAVTYSHITGRCTLLFSIEEEFQLEGFSSASVICSSDDSFVQTLRSARSIVASGCPTVNLDRLNVVNDTVSPKLPEETMYTTLPTFPEFNNEDVPPNSIWRYNPGTPLTLQNEFDSNVSYQIGYGTSNTISYWGQSRGVKDWRHCAWICLQIDGCAYWTYSFDPSSYSSSEGGCKVATSKEPSAPAVSSIQTISGPRMTSLPSDLFGDATVPDGVSPYRRFLSPHVPDTQSRSWKSTYHPRRNLGSDFYLASLLDSSLIGGSGLVLVEPRQLGGEDAGTDTADTLSDDTDLKYEDCRDFGFAYYSAHSDVPDGVPMTPTQSSLVAEDAHTCAEACHRSTGCEAWQFVSNPTLNAYKHLRDSQESPCLLISKVTRKAVGPPFMISGKLPYGSNSRCLSSSKPSSRAASATKMAEADIKYTEDTNKEITTSSLSDEVLTCVIESTGEKVFFADGVSIRGQLISSHPNVLRDVTTPVSCHEECVANSECQAFSWGKWQGCYLLRTIEAFIADTVGVIVSGYRDCRDNLREVSEHARRLDIDDPRSINTCGRVSKGVVYDEGVVLDNSTDYETADDCWRGCRNQHDCFYTTYIQSTKNCFWFEAVTSNKTLTQSSLSVSAEVNCDYLGQIDFPTSWLALQELNTIALVSAATGGLLVLIGGSLILRRNKRPINNDSPTFASQDERKRNVFGMAESPGAMERGSPGSTLRIDDFETITNADKSTGKRLRRCF